MTMNDNDKLKLFMTDNDNKQFLFPV